MLSFSFPPVAQMRASQDCNKLVDSRTNSSNTLERKSASKLGISCLASSTTDEDTSALVKSPEKKTMSPSVQSISDIFAKSVKNRTEEPTGIARLVLNLKITSKLG